MKTIIGIALGLIAVILFLALRVAFVIAPSGPADHWHWDMLAEAIGASLFVFVPIALVGVIILITSIVREWRRYR